MSADTINLAGFDEDAIADGPGLRCVIFVQGCPHHCVGCQNPQTWEFGKGTSTTIRSLYDRIVANALTTGVTFSGGEPFAQPEALAHLAEQLRPRYDLAAYTGYTWEGLMKKGEEDPFVMRLLSFLDVVVDGPFVQSKHDRLLLFRGSANQRIIDVQASLRAGTAVWTRDPGWVGDLGTAHV